MGEAQNERPRWQCDPKGSRERAGMATKFDAELHILHVLETHLVSTPTFGMGLDLPKYVSESKAAAEKSLASILDPKWSAGRTVVKAVIEGSPKVEILAYARKQSID